MSKIDNGGPAFPSEGEGHGNPKYHSPGMSLRDWFAGQVLAASDGSVSPEKEAAWAYKIADAMLAERAKAERQP